MRPLACPIPSNINPLQSNGFQFVIEKIPEVSFYCQEVMLPEITLSSADFDTPLTKIPQAGDKPMFGDLYISFIIDEDMMNYKAVHNWLISLAFPESRQQFRQFINDNINQLKSSVALASSSTCLLQVLNSNNRATNTIEFYDAVPINLSSVTFQSTTNDTMYLVGNASFSYSYFKFK
jgi:hypothetical protein